MKEGLTVVLIILLIILWNRRNRFACEGFESKPTEEQIGKFTNEMIEHRDAFRSLKDAKNKMPWIDAITFEDARMLKLGNKFNKENLSQILRN